MTAEGASYTIQSLHYHNIGDRIKVKTSTVAELTFLPRARARDLDDKVDVGLVIGGNIVY
jgi:hypothetical protein